EENTCEYGVADQHCEQRLNDRRRGGLADTFRAAFDVESGVARNRDHDPGEDYTFDHSRIQIPGVSAFERTHDVAGGVEIEREFANRPTSKHADVISENGQRWKHDQHGKE